MRRFVYSYERKRHDSNGNPRHYAHNITEITAEDEIVHIEKIDIGYSGIHTAIETELKRMDILKETDKLHTYDGDKEATFKLIEV